MDTQHKTHNPVHFNGGGGGERDSSNIAAFAFKSGASNGVGLSVDYAFGRQLCVIFFFFLLNHNLSRFD